jgi:hypothetical protein
MTENPVKQLQCGTHKAPERQEGQGTAGGEATKRSWRKLRPIARDKRKWKELTGNLCF